MKKAKKVSFYQYVPLLFLLLTSWQVSAKINVIASFSIIGDMAKNIGQDRITLRTIVGPNGDAHVYEPSPADAIAMAKADVILINGLQFEGFIKRLIAASETSAPVTETTKDAHIIRDPAGGHYHFYEGKAVFHAAPFDPHAWQSIANAKIYVKNIADAFCAADRSGCMFYQDNARAYTSKLNDLQQKIKAAIATIPEDKRTVVVGHNAFRYFEEDYGIHFLSPQGISTEAEASAADVAGILKEIKQNKASAVFAENISNPRLVAQIAAEADLSVAGTLYSDALSDPAGPASTYLAMMEHNVATITTAVNNGKPRR
ncbi:zinc ABC transporter substrate-binding protein AztC [Superficieibacter sp. 1612_C1]|uniref:zinc ABC transporter substrate-binding protein AztC n=1 Tax=Superficieibacter sp. 1612_C1 TaxID=2780382 RepID=UPI0018848FBE|nr:zinc ABC transporter substrate-binding protein AztC [Superficieibacter sp. 1612_C1]